MSISQVKVRAGWKVVFLRHIKNGKPENTAAHLAKVGKDKLYAERRKDPEFAKEWQDASGSMASA